MNIIKLLLNPSLLIKKIKLKRIEKKFAKISFSQEGEDILLDRILSGSIQNGFYLDIGAHHPIKFSNTYFFYLRGWRGINIDANPNSMKLFNQFRPYDINVEAAIGSKLGELDYYVFNHPEVNTFISSHAKEWDGKGDVKLIEIKKVNVITLSDILQKFSKHIPKSIDLLTIDVEGMDYEIIKNFDFENYRVKFIIIEESGFNIHDVNKGEISNFLMKNRFILISRLSNSSIYKSEFI
jgi:FkbM family methyltransferase